MDLWLGKTAFLVYREHDLNRQLSLARTQLRELRVSNESNHAKLLDHSQRQGAFTVSDYSITFIVITRTDQETVAKLTELDIVTADLERANSRVAAVERRNVSGQACVTNLSAYRIIQELLRAEIETVRSGNEASTKYVRIHPLVITPNA